MSPISLEVRKDLNHSPRISKSTDYSGIECAREIKAIQELDMDWLGAASICTQGFVAKKRN